jgi:hypothetical protein
MSNIIREGKAQYVILFGPAEDVGIEDAQVIVYDSGVVSIKTDHEDVTSHMMRTEIIWNAACPHDSVEQDKEEPKLVHLNRMKKKDEPTH